MAQNRVERCAEKEDIVSFRESKDSSVPQRAAVTAYNWTPVMYLYKISLNFCVVFAVQGG